MDDVKLVETTLRDGSYEIDFQFTADDTALIAAALDQAGVAYIELCHGNGIGSHLWGPRHLSKIRAAATDEEHLAAAQEVVERAAYGVFMMAGAEFTPVDYLSILPKHGAKFVRFGIRADHLEMDAWYPYVTRAKELGLIAAVNVMQACAIEPSRIAAAAKTCAKLGTDWFYIVDSAGEMTPTQTQTYVRAVLEESGLRTGLHAHNNSGMAMANTLAAVEAGATLVDSTLQGIGRATGNATTERLLLALQKMGHELAIAREPIMLLGEATRALFAEQGNDAIYFVSGVAGIHSRAIPTLRAAAAERRRSPLELLWKLGLEVAAQKSTVRDRFAPPQLDAILSALPERTSVTLPRKLEERLTRSAARAAWSPVAVCEQLYETSLRRRKTSVLHLVPREAFPFGAPLPWETRDHVGLTVPVGDDQAWTAVPADRQPQVLVMEHGAATPAGLAATRSSVGWSLRAFVAETTVNAVANMQRALAARVWMPAGEGKAAQSVRSRLADSGIAIDQAPATSGPRLAIASPETLPAALAALAAGDTIVFLGSGAAKLVDEARQKRIRVVRPLCAEAIGGHVAGTIALAERLAAEDAGGPLVDPAIVASSSEIAVDDRVAPTCVLDAGARVDAAAVVASARARALLGGTRRM